VIKVISNILVQNCYKQPRGEILHWSGFSN